MKKMLKKILTLTTVLACTFAMLVPVSVQAAVTAPKTQVVYLNSKTYSGYTSIYLNGLKKSSKITNVKTDNKNIANPYGVTRYNYDYETINGSNYKYNDYYGYISIDYFKKGTAKISYKIDGKNYSTKIKVYEYENPVKSAKITGKVSGKSKTIKLTDLTKKQNVGVVTNKSKMTSPKVTIEAAKGWKITNVSWSGMEDDQNVSISKSLNRVSKATLKLNVLAAKKYSNINVSFINEKTGGTMSVAYRINN